MTEESGDPVVVPQKARYVNVIWGFLTLVFGLALVRGHFGAATSSGRIVVDVIFGALVAGSIGAWLWFRRHPARLEVSPEVITFSHRGQPNSVRLVRASGDLYVYTTTSAGGKGRLRYLKVPGSDEGVPLQLFDWGEVQGACIARGWRFTDQRG
jgi:hypothetical protein